MLDLIYSGHPEEAWAFMGRMWEAGTETKQTFKADFLRQLALSDYAEYLPVDFQGYEPDLNDVSEKKYLRFKNYYNRVLKSMELIEKETSTSSKVPTLNSINIENVLRGWSGQ